MLRLFGEKGRGTFVGLLGSPLGTGFSGKREGGLLWASWEVLWGPAHRGNFAFRHFLSWKKNILTFANLAYYVGRGAAKAVNLSYGVDDC